MKLSAFFLVAGFVVAAEAPPPSEAVLAAYRSYERATREPKSIGAQFAGLCGFSPVAADIQKNYGPHAQTWLHYYLNPLANEHRQSRAKSDWPAGSVIVKEKLKSGDAAHDKDWRVVTAVAGMIKGAPGSSPRTNDWEFFYFANRAERPWIKPGEPVPSPKWVKSEQISHCLDCHAAGGHDFVFGRFGDIVATKR